MKASKLERNYKMATTILSVISLLLATGLVISLTRQPKIVSNFEQCKKADGLIMESYPEQCMINGVSFTNQAQSIDGNAYIGMTEEDALSRAKEADVPARVVERDGEGLPVTMDFVFGRHNFFVRDGKVYKVDIEGFASDLRE